MNQKNGPARDLAVRRSSGEIETRTRDFPPLPHDRFSFIEKLFISIGHLMFIKEFSNVNKRSNHKMEYFAGYKAGTFLEEIVLLIVLHCLAGVKWQKCEILTAPDK